MQNEAVMEKISGIQRWVAASLCGKCRIDGLDQMSYAVSLRQHQVNAHGGHRALRDILGVHGEHDPHEEGIDYRPFWVGRDRFTHERIK